MQHKLDVGTKVTFNGEGEIVSRISTQNGVTYGVKVGTDQQWTITLLPGMAKLRPITPPHTELDPGQLWQADGILWMAQLRRADLPLRLSPQDMSTETGLRTLDEDTFFQTYPDAVLTYDPTQTNLVIETDPEAITKAMTHAMSSLAPLRERLTAQPQGDRLSTGRPASQDNGQA